jgi:hypothetical protein
MREAPLHKQGDICHGNFTQNVMYNDQVGPVAAEMVFDEVPFREDERKGAPAPFDLEPTTSWVSEMRQG